jgi:hypothetical protein
MSGFEDFVEEISLVMMERNGYDIDDTSYRIEFDTSRNDSQLSIIREDVTFVLRYLEEHGVCFDDFQPNYGEVIVGVSPIKKGFNTESINHITLGKESNFTDLKDFVTQLELMELPEDTELDGYLSVTLKVDNPVIERITCGDCGYKDYLTTPNDH